MIPKKVGASESKDFRPISLIGSFYEIISKILTERLKRVMPKSVDDQQMTFIKGRQIMDAILVANECRCENHIQSPRNSFQVRHRKSLWSLELGIFVEHTQEDGVWQHLDKMDEVLSDHIEVLCFDQ